MQIICQPLPSINSVHTQSSTVRQRRKESERVDHSRQYDNTDGPTGVQRLFAQSLLSSTEASKSQTATARGVDFVVGFGGWDGIKGKNELDESSRDKARR